MIELVVFAFLAFMYIAPWPTLAVAAVIATVWFAVWLLVAGRWHFFQALVAFAVWSALYATGGFPEHSYAPVVLAGCAAFGATAALAWTIDKYRAWRWRRRASRPLLG